MSVLTKGNHKVTPDPLFAWANERWGPFTLDAAASNANAKCEWFHTEEDDGLTQPWGGRVWINPPWAKIPLWTRRAAVEVYKQQRVDLVCMLLPLRNGTLWYRNAERYARIHPISGRIKFGTDNGEPAGDGGFEYAGFFIFERRLEAKDFR